MRVFRSSLRWLRRYGLSLLFYSVIVIGLIPRSVILINDRWQAVAVEVSPHQFDYIGWELGALSAKVNQTLYGQHPFMTEADRSDFVRDYMTDLAAAQSLAAQINAVYTDPSIEDPDTATDALRMERDAMREDLKARQSLAEAILEGQVAAVLVDAGFGVGGQLLPPMSMRFYPVPNLLVTSPRDIIQMESSLNLYPLPIDEIVAIEDRLEARYDVSALIVPLGGIALYPAMIMETASIPRAVEVFAHEWLHHYLYFFPLGLDYITNSEGFAGESRIINETTADLFGKEIAREVLLRYYPDLVPPPPQPSPETQSAESTPTPPVFDFATAMHETRVTVDDLLAAGDIEAAEAYMAERRQLFYENGYPIRRLNQAFFAFYGGYQAGGMPGVGGEDPIGPAIRRIRDSSPSIHDFIVTMRTITDREMLLTVADSEQMP